MKTLLIVCTLLSALLPGQALAQTSFVMNLGGAAGLETASNTLVIAGNGVSATIKSWSISRTETDARLQRSEVVQWAPGIGSKNSTEMITTVPYVPHYVDNEDHYDLVLFVFDRKVDLTSFSLNPSGNNFDTDVTYWFGNVNPDVSLTNRTLRNLWTRGFGSAIHNDTAPSTSSRTVALTSPVDGINAILIGARVGGDTGFDRFKLSTVRGVTVVPEPGAAMLMGLAGMIMLLRRRR